MNETLHLPPFVNYDCQLCGWCCHQYDITFSKADHERLSKYDWGKLEPSLAGKEWCAPLSDSATPDKFHLRYAEDGSCVFLGPDNKCLMHKHVGELGKTMACGAYPFTFAGTPTGVYVGMRFSCKAVACGLGEPVVRRTESVRRQLALCREAGQVPQYSDTVPFEGGVNLAWSDYLLLEEALIRIYLRDDLPMARRLFMAHKLVDILRQARLDRVRGRKFAELLGILETGLVHEAESDPLPGPVGGIRNVMYRQFLFLFQRRQGGSYRELGFFGKLGVRLQTFWTGVLFALGAGTAQLPALSGPVPLGKIASIPLPELGPAGELAVSRFLAAKLHGKQHFGKLFFNYSLIQGLTFLTLSAGAVMWYARAHALARGAQKADVPDVLEAIRYVDFCYGYSSAAALILERMRVRILSRDDAAIRLALAQYA